jgi:hypothetical protein
MRSVAAPATNVDIAPTLLMLAGVDIPTDSIDGHSFMSFLLPDADEPEVPEYLRPTLRSEIQHRQAAGWRESVFVHHYRVGAGSYCGDGHHIDQEDNNFIAVRHLPGSKYGNVLYAECEYYVLRESMSILLHSCSESALPPWAPQSNGATERPT